MQLTQAPAKNLHELSVGKSISGIHRKVQHFAKRHSSVYGRKDKVTRLGSVLFNQKNMQSTADATTPQKPINNSAVCTPVKKETRAQMRHQSAGCNTQILSDIDDSVVGEGVGSGKVGGRTSPHVSKKRTSIFGGGTVTGGNNTNINTTTMCQSTGKESDDASQSMKL